MGRLSRLLKNVEGSICKIDVQTKLSVFTAGMHLFAVFEVYTCIYIYIFLTIF